VGDTPARQPPVLRPLLEIPVGLRSIGYIVQCHYVRQFVTHPDGDAGGGDVAIGGVRHSESVMGGDGVEADVVDSVLYLSPPQRHPNRHQAVGPRVGLQEEVVHRQGHFLRRHDARRQWDHFPLHIGQLYPKYYDTEEHDVDCVVGQTQSESQNRDRI